MKVKRHGSTYREVVYPGCGALLSYCYLDTRGPYWVWDDIRKGFVDCPECGKEVTVMVPEE